MRFSHSIQRWLGCVDITRVHHYQQDRMLFVLKRQYKITPKNISIRHKIMVTVSHSGWFNRRLLPKRWTEISDILKLLVRRLAILFYRLKSVGYHSMDVTVPAYKLWSLEPFICYNVGNPLKSPLRYAQSGFVPLLAIQVFWWATVDYFGVLLTINKYIFLCFRKKCLNIIAYCVL